MPLPSEEAFRQLFRELGAAERLTFVAELWTARGWETTVVDGAVIAVRDGEQQRICVLNPGRFGTAVPDDADVLVPVQDRPSVRTASRRAGIRYVPPAELRKRLLYGVDRDTAATLFAEAFGHPLDAETHVGPSRSEQLRSVASELRQHSQDRFGGSPIAVSVLVVALLVGVAVAGPVLVPNDADRAEVVETTTLSPGETDPAGGSGGEGTDTEENLVLPPGVVESSINDRSALIEAHQLAVTDRQRTLHVAADGPPNATFMSGRLVWNYTMRAEGSSHYTVDANATYPPESASARAGPTTVRTSVFSNDGVTYRRRVNATGTAYDRYPIEKGGNASMFTDDVSRFLRMYLRGKQWSVDCVTESDAQDAHCSVIMSGVPAAFPKAESYRVSATIKPSGLVSSFSVSYTLPDTDGDGTRDLVRLGFEYEALDTTTVSEPAWLPEAKNETSD